MQVDREQKKNNDSGDTQKTDKHQGENFRSLSPDELDQQVKNEPDTERLRSERQSVKDGEKKNSKQ